LIATTMRSLSILAIAVTLGIGPTGAGVCGAFCADESVRQECHEAPAALVTGDCCDRPSTNTTGVAGSELRPQHFSSPNISACQRPIEAPVHFARPTRNQPLGLQADSLATVLRI
jgi:hypothetical protein